jgi:uncharacterized protein
VRLDAPPPSASWTHRGVRAGFEVVFLDAGDLPSLRGDTAAREGSSLWSVCYRIDLADDWSTRTVGAINSTADGERRAVLARAPGDRWTVDGLARPDLNGCVDVDFESSAVTNTLPVHRIEFEEGATVRVPAAFVRAEDLRVERIEQNYTFLGRFRDGLRFHYASETFGFECELMYDTAGLILAYPGIATRHS